MSELKEKNGKKVLYLLFGTQLIDGPEQKEVVYSGDSKQHRALQLLSKEYKYENFILLVLALFAIVLGALLVKKVLLIDESFPIIGEYQVQFAWVLISLGIVSLILVAWPFYRPSIAEIKHVKGYKRAELFINLLRVIVFILIMAAFFVLCDYVLQKLFISNVKEWINPTK